MCVQTFVRYRVACIKPLIITLSYTTLDILFHRFACRKFSYTVHSYIQCFPRKMRPPQTGDKYIMRIFPCFIRHSSLFFLKLYGFAKEYGSTVKIYPLTCIQCPLKCPCTPIAIIQTDCFVQHRKCSIETPVADSNGILTIGMIYDERGYIYPDITAHCIK